MISLIWAQAANGVIGRDGAIPWRLPEDVTHFRELTAGSTVLMGRRTWDSLPARFRPLPGRCNLVLTRDLSWAAEGAEPVHDLDSVVYGDRSADLWVIGGAEVYRATLPCADRLVVTELREAFDGDAYAPRPAPAWREAAREPAGGWAESTTSLHYRFRYLRRL